MANALKQGLRVQSGIESTWGTIVPATAIHAGDNTIRYKPDDTVSERTELNGILTKTTGSPDVLGTAGSVYEAGYLTYQEHVRLMESAYKTVSPSADAGTPIAYTRVYAGPTTTEYVPVSRTLEAGGLTEAFAFPGAVVAEYEWSAAIKGYTMFTARWIAKDMVAQAFTGALSRRTVTRALSQLWSVFADTTWAGLGGTPITSCITNIAYKSGPLYTYSNCINGVTTPTAIIQAADQQPEVTLTFKLSAETLALFAAYRAGTVKFLRLKNLGAVAIHGTPNVFPTIQYDLAGAIMAYPEVGDAVADNALTIPITFKGVYDPTAGKIQEITNISSLLVAP
jgi:hypothetical protein